MYCQQLDKLVHISQQYRQKRHPTVCRIKPIFHIIVNSFQLAESAKTLYYRVLYDTKRSFRQNPLNSQFKRQKNQRETQKKMLIKPNEKHTKTNDTSHFDWDSCDWDCHHQEICVKYIP